MKSIPVMAAIPTDSRVLSPSMAESSSKRQKTDCFDESALDGPVQGSVSQLEEKEMRDVAQPYRVDALQHLSKMGEAGRVSFALDKPGANADSNSTFTQGPLRSKADDYPILKLNGESITVDDTPTTSDHLLGGRISPPADLGVRTAGRANNPLGNSENSIDSGSKPGDTTDDSRSDRKNREESSSDGSGSNNEESDGMDEDAQGWGPSSSSSRADAGGLGMGLDLQMLLRMLGNGSGDDGDSHDQMRRFLLAAQLGLLPAQLVARKKLPHVNTISDAVSLIRNAQNIVLLTGAGISVSCGIPDFRSENGIYARLAEYNLPSPQSMFELSFFRENPVPFFLFAKELFPSVPPKYKPSKSHYFIKLLHEKGKLLRNYTQNIDGLERLAGLSMDKAFPCHGHFETASCIDCHKKFSGVAIRSNIESGSVPHCQDCGRTVKPDIVFFGEKLPAEFHSYLENDEDSVDLVIVMGSSLKVNPVRSIVTQFPKEVPMILINREVAGQPSRFDVELLGNCDAIVEHLANELGWEIPTFEVHKDLAEASQAVPSQEDREGTDTSLASLPEFIGPNRYLFEGAITTNSDSDQSEVDSSGDEGEMSL